MCLVAKPREFAKGHRLSCRQNRTWIDIFGNKIEHLINMDYRMRTSHKHCLWI